MTKNSSPSDFKDVSLRVLSAASDGPSNSAGITCLPVEVLARCFLFLPMDLSRRLPILHVSRTWRAVALDFPDIWAQILISDVTASRSLHFLVEMLVSAHLEYPFDFSAASSKDWASTFDMCMVLEEHMHHLRSIDWPDCLDLMTFTRPAPHLERISGISLGTIPVRFLDGQPGRLRVLNLPQLSLPPRLCPALSLVTHLTASITDGHHTKWALTQLFEQFPSLEHLDLDIYINNSSLLPLGPAPASLTTLRLNSMHGDSAFRTFNQIDLLAVSDAWLTPNVTSLDVCWFTMNAADIARIVDGALELSATDESELEEEESVFQLSWDAGMPADEKYVISGRRDDERLTAVLRFGPPVSPTPEQIALILAERMHSLAFSQLHRLSLSSAVLHAFAPHAGPGGLSVLSELRVIVRPQLNELYRPHEFNWQPRLVFPWSHLARIPFAPRLLRIEVDVPTTRRRRLDAADAGSLVSVLLGALAARLDDVSSTDSEPLSVDVYITGFSDDVVRDFRVPSQDHSAIIVFV